MPVMAALFCCDMHRKTFVRFKWWQTLYSIGCSIGLTYIMIQFSSGSKPIYNKGCSIGLIDITIIQFSSGGKPNII